MKSTDDFRASEPTWLVVAPSVVDVLANVFVPAWLPPKCFSGFPFKSEKTLVLRWAELRVDTAKTGAIGKTGAVRKCAGVRMGGRKKWKETTGRTSG